MKTNNCILKYSALAALVFGTASISSAAGLLGQRYIGATFDWVSFDESALDDGLGFSAVFNQPLTSNIDLSLSYSYLDSGVGSTNITAQDGAFSATFFVPIDRFKGYVRAGVGFVRPEAAGFSETEESYQLEAGFEIPLGAKMAVTPFVAYADTWDNDDLDLDAATFGVTLEYQISDPVSLIGIASSDDDSNWGLSAGAVFRF